MLTLEIVTNKIQDDTNSTPAIVSMAFTLASMVNAKIITGAQALSSSSQLLATYEPHELEEAFSFILNCEDDANGAGDEDSAATYRLMNDFVSPLF